VSVAETSLKLFLRGFTARDIASPLRSFDDATLSATILAATEQNRIDVVGVRAAGAIVGWRSRDDVERGSPVRPFDPAAVVDDGASLNEVLQKSTEGSPVFVRVFDEIAGVIGLDDLQKAPMRMWLFGLVTTTELRVTQFIEELYPADAWQQYLSPGRVELAAKLQAERRRRGQQPSLLECLQLSDKGQIVARDEQLRRLTRFDSRRGVERFVGALQNLRNNLAHAHDISGDWEVIRDLAINLHRIVLGPDASPPADSITGEQAL
jgi:hypothetical protein